MAGRERQADQRVSLYILLRMVIGLALLGFTYLAVQDQPGHLLERSPEFILAAGVFFAMGISAWLVPRYGRSLRFVWSQMVIDTIFATALVSLTDGPASPLFPLYFLNILAATWLLPPNGAIIVAAMDVLAFGLMMVIHSFGWVNWEFEAAGLVLYTEVVLRVFAFFLVGFLSSMLSTKLQLTRRELALQVAATATLRERHELVLEELQTGVLITDSAGAIISVNPAVARLLGHVVGVRLEDVLPGEGAHFEHRHMIGEERRRYLCSRTHLTGGGAVVLVEDVTQLRELEMQVEREERLAGVGRMAAGLSHEIRNPLASLSGAVQMMREKDPSPLHEIVLREVNRLNELVEEFLDSSRPVKLRIERIDVGEVIQNVVAAFRTDARYQATRVVRTRVKRLPEVEMDRGRLEQVLWNLLLNAAQSTPEFGTIEITSEVRGDTLIVEVADDGVGIPPAALARIFDPFYTTRAGGTGLGLANVERIVRAHDGKIAVQSVPGSGARFTMEFPLRQAQQPDEAHHAG
jgi:two-component system sensor histidine kinase PilS (NtrC family)